MKCPRCDQPRQPEERECSNCGIDFNYVAKRMARSPESIEPMPSREVVPSDPAPPAETEVVEAPDETPVVVDTDTHEAPVGDEHKPCPKCGFHNQGQALECLRCGIIFNKYEVYLEKRRKAEEETNQTTDGLLDPETIQMAAEASRQTQPSPAYAKTACPHCGQRFKIRNDQVGITTRCKKCSSIFKIELLPTIEP